MNQQTNVTTAPRKKIHFIAATFYTLIAIAGLAFAVGGQPSMLVGAAVAGLYSAYLWRGGRWVVFIF